MTVFLLQCLPCRFPLAENGTSPLLTIMTLTIAIYEPMIFTAPCVMLCRQIHYEGKWDGIGPGNQNFFGPCETSKDTISVCERFYNILRLCIICDPNTVSF